MRKLLIVCYYELKDYLQTIASLFVDKYVWDVVHYPLYMYCYDKHSKIDNYLEHFNLTIKKEKPDVILWWFTDVPLNIFNTIKKENPGIFYVMYNLNDPLNINKIFFDKCKIFDMILTPCKHNMYMYKTYSSVPDVKFFPMGTDPQLFKPLISDVSDLDLFIPDNHKSSDGKFKISFLCESLYTDYKDQLIPRKTIIHTIQNLCVAKDWVFDLYGTEFLSSMYPSVYRGDPDYLEKPSIFASSDVNIVSHPVKNKYVVMDSHIIQIMSCGGLILMDDTYGANAQFNTGDECVMFFANLETVESQLIGIWELWKDKKINNHNNRIDVIKKNAINYALRYTWENFVDAIYSGYCKSRFDPVFYNKTYDLGIHPAESTEHQSTQNLYDVWTKRQLEGNKEICFSVSVPPAFDHENYRTKYGIESQNLEYLYIDWWLKGKNPDFMIKNRNQSNMISGTKMNIVTTELLGLYSAFNKVNESNPDSKVQGIKSVALFAKRNPRLAINDALRQYIEISQTE